MGNKASYTLKHDVGERYRKRSADSLEKATNNTKSSNPENVTSEQMENPQGSQPQENVAEKPSMTTKVVKKKNQKETTAAKKPPKKAMGCKSSAMKGGFGKKMRAGKRLGALGNSRQKPTEMEPLIDENNFEEREPAENTPSTSGGDQAVEAAVHFSYPTGGADLIWDLLRN